jgi:DNA-binding FrmR family transcriptional regulator
MDPIIEDTDRDMNTKRLVKNRESARNTRKKKKQQLEYLEKCVAELTEEVESLRQETKTREDYKNGEITQKYKSDKQKLFDTLERLLNTGGEEEQIKQIIETLRVKMGTSGVERQGYIEYLIHQISDIALPIQVKSLLNLENNKSSYFWEELLDLNYVSPEQQEKLEGYLSMITKKTEDFKNTIKKLKRIKKCLLRRTGHLQSIIDYISSQLTCTQIAALLVRINKENNSFNPWIDS